MGCKTDCTIEIACNWGYLPVLKPLSYHLKTGMLGTLLDILIFLPYNVS